MSARAPYDKYPYIAVAADSSLCCCGWREIGDRLRGRIAPGAVVVVECYPGTFVPEIEEGIAAQLCPESTIRAAEAMRSADEIEAILHPYLTDDPVFGFMNSLPLDSLFDPVRLELLRRRIVQRPAGVTLVLGTGATLIAPQWDILVYADLARWEIQQRQRRRQISNLGADNCAERPNLKYKRAFFADWRMADRLKRELLGKVDFLLDTNDPDHPKMIGSEDFRHGLDLAVSRPFRVVPFFDPGPWGGNWMREQFDLPPGPPNYAWGFDCVPEENSLLLGFGERRVEIPAIDVVFWRPQDLLGEAVHQRFGAEFPIRFDLLDTMNGGNLSLQVHPLAAYVWEHFGMSYTQDESYYLLEAAPDACVYLGLKDDIKRGRMTEDLRRAQSGAAPFPAEKYVNRWPARKHDHFLIPAGTIHCSGRNSVVLEISATPYIFTFKLWDWERLGLDGIPRPVHLEHGLANIQWDRRANWVRKNLVNQVEDVARGSCWREERTGLHALEFIETRRHWFTGPTPHDTNGSVNVLNLVEGEEAVVESPEGRFQSFAVHYAETFIVPAALGRYTITPTDRSRQCATVRASVRPSRER